jgi:hypothetical protein
MAQQDEKSSGGERNNSAAVIGMAARRAGLNKTAIFESKPVVPGGIATTTRGAPRLAGIRT